MMPMLYREIPVLTFEQQWRITHDSVFNGRPAQEQPFLKQEWERLLIPYGLSMEPSVFNALGRAARLKHDLEAVIHNFETIEPQPAASIDWTYQALDEARCSLLGHFETHLFGSSGTWGVVCTVNDVSCVAGEPVFMDALVNSLGGREILKERFLQFDAVEWRIPQEIRLKLLRLVNWI